jgi:hypothetical protein
MITRRQLQTKKVIVDNIEEGAMMAEEMTQLEGVIINESGGDSEEVTDMQCGQPTEGEIGGIRESRGEQATSADKKEKDNTIDMQTILSFMREMREESRKESEKNERSREENNKRTEEMFREIREIRKENEKNREEIREEFRKDREKRAKEHKEWMERMFGVHEREILSPTNQIASDVEQSTDRKSEAETRGISTISESTNGQFQALTEKVQEDKLEMTEVVRNDKIEITNKTLRQVVTESHAQLAKQSENRCERVNQCEK